MKKSEICRNPGLLLGIALVLISSQLAPCQCTIGLAAATPFMASSTVQLPAYEVATIKPWDGNGFAMPLRSYIQRAFGISPNLAWRVIGPDWINTTKYVIDAKPPEAIAIAMQKMTNEERMKETQMMMQSLLADRFQLKTHFETREMPEYELVLAKGGPKLKEASDANKGLRVAVGGSMIRATGAPITVIFEALECTPDVGGREVVDKTGLTGTYDFTLKWTPVQTETTPNGGGSASPTDTQAASLFTAIQEQLGLKLVSAKGSAQVLVIDSIAKPSPN